MKQKPKTIDTSCPIQVVLIRDPHTSELLAEYWDKSENGEHLLSMASLFDASRFVSAFHHLPRVAKLLEAIKTERRYFREVTAPCELQSEASVFSSKVRLLKEKLKGDNPPKISELDEEAERLNARFVEEHKADFAAMRKVALPLLKELAELVREEFGNPFRQRRAKQ